VVSAETSCTGAWERAEVDAGLLFGVFVRGLRDAFVVVVDIGLEASGVRRRDHGTEQKKLLGVYLQNSEALLDNPNRVILK
jgi:hypothetical protein